MKRKKGKQALQKDSIDKSILKSLKKRDLFLLAVIHMLSLVIFVYYAKINVPGSYYDELGYTTIAQEILKVGLLNVKTYINLRTYLYPAIISIFFCFGNKLFVVKLIFSLFQFGLYVFTVHMIARLGWKNYKTKTAYFTILIGGLLNPYLIQSTSLFLTDNMAACFMMLAMIVFFVRNINSYKEMCLAFGLLYSSILIRPANALFLPVIFLLMLYYFRKKPNCRPQYTGLAAITMLILFIPQLYLNIVNYNDYNPLIHENLYAVHNVLAAEFLKFGGVLAQGEIPQLFYYSPFSEVKEIVNYSQINISTETNFWGLAREDFVGWLFLCIVHIFGLIDWGYVETYIRSFYSASRLIGSLFLYVAWFFIFKGIYLYVINKKTKKVLLPFLISSIAYILFYSATCVESRYGYPIYFLLLIFAPVGVESVIKARYGGVIKMVVNVLPIILFLFFMFYCSFWLDLQTGRIDWFNYFKG